MCLSDTFIKTLSLVIYVTGLSTRIRVSFHHLNTKYAMHKTLAFGALSMPSANVLCFKDFWKLELTKSNFQS